MNGGIETIRISDLSKINEILYSLNANTSSHRRFRLQALSIIQRKQRNAILWKTIGLILTDGDFSNLIKQRGPIAFRGLSYDTAVAVIMTLVQIVESITIWLSNIEGRTYYNVIVPSSNNSNILKQEIIYILTKLDITPDEILSKLKLDELAALLSGIIDGDGYFGKPSTYISVSFNISSKKGKIINEIISFLQKQGYIIINKYYHKPKYEATFSFTDLEFMHKCLEYVYHDKRRKRMKRYIVNYMRNYICSFSTLELKQILRIVSSLYIDHRKPPRKSKVLVLYIRTSDFKQIAHLWNNNRLPPEPHPIRNGNRVIIKISEKCKKNLRGVINDNNKLDSKIIETIKEFLKT